MPVKPMMRPIHFADHLERRVAEALHEAGIRFVHESENAAQDLDFYLPYFDVYLEVKQFHAPRIERQMASRDNVIAIQGGKSVHLLMAILFHGRNPTAGDAVKGDKDVDR